MMVPEWLRDEYEAYAANIAKVGPGGMTLISDDLLRYLNFGETIVGTDDANFINGDYT